MQPRGKSRAEPRHEIRVRRCKTPRRPRLPLPGRTRLTGRSAGDAPRRAGALMHGERDQNARVVVRVPVDVVVAVAGKRAAGDRDDSSP